MVFHRKGKHDDDDDDDDRSKIINFVWDDTDPENNVFPHKNTMLPYGALVDVELCGRRKR